MDIGGNSFEMVRRGFACRSAFTVAEQGADFTVLELRESPDTLARYSFPFLLRVRHRLLEDGFSTSFTVEDPGEKKELSYRFTLL